MPVNLHLMFNINLKVLWMRLDFNEDLNFILILEKWNKNRTFYLILLNQKCIPEFFLIYGML